MKVIFLRLFNRINFIYTGCSNVKFLSLNILHYFESTRKNRGKFCLVLTILELCTLYTTNYKRGLPEGLTPWFTVIVCVCVLWWKAIASLRFCCCCYWECFRNVVAAGQSLWVSTGHTAHFLLGRAQTLDDAILFLLVFKLLIFFLDSLMSNNEIQLLLN